MPVLFSSRRRHTRWPRDWSSDVCSSDLRKVVEKMALLAGAGETGQIGGKQHIEQGLGLGIRQCLHDRTGINLAQRREIGRASCRERASVDVVDRRVVEEVDRESGGGDKQ